MLLSLYALLLSSCVRLPPPSLPPSLPRSLPRWTQWIFLQLFNKGLAYQAEVPVNWCPALGTGELHGACLDVLGGGLSDYAGVKPARTVNCAARLCSGRACFAMLYPNLVFAVLANEEVIDGVSERGGHPVVRMPMKQWMLKITAYGDR